jgi:hypothetical protein
MISISVPSLALSADVATRKRHEDHIEFVLRELSHRSKNLLAVVRAWPGKLRGKPRISRISTRRFQPDFAPSPTPTICS